MLPTSAGVEPAPSWSPVGRRIQLSHRGRLNAEGNQSCMHSTQMPPPWVMPKQAMQENQLTLKCNLQFTLLNRHPLLSKYSCFIFIRSARTKSYKSFTEWLKIYCIGPRGYKTFFILNSAEHEFSYSTQLSMKFSLQINKKMPTIIGVFIFASRENFHAQLCLARKNLQWLVSNLRFISRTNFMLRWIEHEKSL